MVRLSNPGWGVHRVVARLTRCCVPVRLHTSGQLEGRAAGAPRRFRSDLRAVHRVIEYLTDTLILRVTSSRRKHRLDLPQRFYVDRGVYYWWPSGKGKVWFRRQDGSLMSLRKP